MLIPVILSGGIGSRLWPVSREMRPKPFMQIGSSRQTLLGQTYDRALSVLGQEACPLVVTNYDHYFSTREELSGFPAAPHFLLEPCGRNTAPAILVAAFWAQSKYPGSQMLVMPADHLIADKGAFIQAVIKASNLARDGKLVVFGIPPTRPETGFGYLEIEDGNRDSGGYVVRRFVEKPDASAASYFLEQGNYLWNSGMFCFAASAVLDAFASCASELYTDGKQAWTHAESDGDRTVLPDSFADLQSISIDYAVMEKASNIEVVTDDFGWSDVGCWEAVAETLQADTSGNTSIGQTFVSNSQNIHVQSDSRFVAALGVNNLLIVDTPDALLVADKRHAQDVRKVVNYLKESGNDLHRVHRTVGRPWGTYTVLEAGPGFKIKRIVVKPGQSLSLQMHHYRSEHWVVVSGIAHVTVDDVTAVIKANESTYIPIGAKHRLQNRNADDLIIIEVQCGDNLSEDDIVRFSDDYGRA